MHFADDIVLGGVLRKKPNGKVEMWRHALRTHKFCVSRS